MCVFILDEKSGKSLPHFALHSVLVKALVKQTNKHTKKPGLEKFRIVIGPWFLNKRS